MKKRLTIVGMLFLAILVMVGCGKNQQATTKEKETKPEELTLYIVRHGKTMLNTTDRVQGWSDAVLTKSCDSNWDWFERCCLSKCI